MKTRCRGWRFGYLYRMALFGSIPTLRAQLASNPAIAAALTYVDEIFQPDSPVMARIKSVPVGEPLRIDLAHGVYAMEQAYLTKARAAARLESHLQYIDIQVIVEGDEQMAVTDVKYCAVVENLTPSKDLIFYRDVPDASLLRLRAGEAAVYFPVDAHMPCLLVDKPAIVRKTVVKVPVL